MLLVLRLYLWNFLVPGTRILAWCLCSILPGAVAWMVFTMIPRRVKWKGWYGILTATKCWVVTGFSQFRRKNALTKNTVPIIGARSSLLWMRIPSLEHGAIAGFFWTKTGMVCSAERNGCLHVPLLHSRRRQAIDFLRKWASALWCDDINSLTTRFLNLRWRISTWVRLKCDQKSF